MLINSKRSFDELGLAEIAQRFRRERLLTVPATEIALKHLGRPLPNAVLLGGFAALSGLITLEAVAHAIRAKFAGKVGREQRRRGDRGATTSSAASWRSSPMLKQTEGSHAVAEAVALCRPDVICAYPISPQTHIVEGLGELVKSGALAPCEFINVESEFAAMSVAIGSSAAGARTYTATASQGLLFMAEAVYNASGLGLPIVMTVANRAIGAPINIWNDHSDSMSQRDSGWLQLFAETNQEALDLHIQAFRLAEELSMPVMVCMDGFILTHAYERVDIPEQAEVDAFLPPYEPRQVLDPADPVSIGAMVGPEAFMEVRYLAHAKQISALERIPRIAAEFEERFGRNSGGLVRGYRCEDAETIVVALGSVIGTLKDTIDALRDERRQGRRARHPVVPSVPARRGARGAAGRRARRRAREELLRRPRRRRLDRCPPRPLGPAAARLHGRRRPRRTRDHQGVARAHAARGDRRPAGAAHLPRPRLAHRQPPARARGADAPQRADRREPAARRRSRSQRRWRDMNQAVKFYQTGTFTVGNRLLAPEQRTVQASIERNNSLNSGHRACQGCGEALGARYAIDAAMRATGNQLIAANATGCLEVFSTPYPESSWQLPWIHSLFGNAAAVGTGIAAALKVKALKAGQAQSNVRVIAQGGDGGTTDIGFGCLSGMFERNDDVLYICYDNEAYMNTGVQRSSATPPAARTATTMAVGDAAGRRIRQGQERAADRDGARDPLRRHGDRRRPARPRGQGRARDERCTARATCTSSCPARSAGARRATTRSGSPGWRARPASSRCSRPSTAR